MKRPLRVLVHGTGFAGQGHARAFRAGGAEVVGMVGRTDAVVQRVARDLGIAHAGTDWLQALHECRPDVVSIGTPGGAHFEPIEQAMAAGCHVLSDKPLTDRADTALALWRMARQHRVKTAYAASFRYAPGVLHARALVQAGAIGEPLEIECISHFHLERLIPFGWSHRREDGGGRLNNHFTHLLSIVTSIVGERILGVMGEVRDDLGRAPIVEGVHNFNQRREFIPRDPLDPQLRWGESNVEWSYTVMARIDSALASRPVSVLFRHGGLQPRFQDDHIAIHGSLGSLYIKGHYGSGPVSINGADRQWRALPLPADIAATLPPEADETQQNWCYLIREFLKDIRGEACEAYPSFREGARDQLLIEQLRRNGCWAPVDGMPD